MREPTDEQVAAFKSGWEWQDERRHDLLRTPQEGERTRAGLRAVLALEAPKLDEAARRLGLLDSGVARLAEDAIASAPNNRTTIEWGLQHLQAAAAVEQAHALHRIANALEALGRGEQVKG